MIRPTSASRGRRRHPARGSSSWLETSSTYGTPWRRHHATAACEANVLHPETTTTSGDASRSARTTPGVTG